MGWAMNKFYIRDNENDPPTAWHPRRERSDVQSFAIGALKVLAFFALCFGAYREGNAQETSPAGAISSSLKTGNEPLTVTLTGTLTNAFNCVASGAASFTGARASVNGVLTLNETVVLKAGEVPKITCDGRGFASLLWTPPTKNTDGSALTDLSSFELYQGTDPANLKSALTVAPTLSTYTLTGVVRGTWYYAVKAIASSAAAPNRPSALSNVASKIVVPPSLAFPADVMVTKAPTIPNPPTNLTVVDQVAFEIKPNSTGTLVATRIGIVPAGTQCETRSQVVAKATYNGVPRAVVDLVNWPSNTKLQDVWAKCS
jgi:hypothetical protein